MTEKTGLLSAKIAKASIDVGSFVADKRNKEQNYAYISADAVLSKGGDALAQNGVAVVPSVTTIDVQTVERAGKSARIDAKVSFVMSIMADGETRECMWFGFGSDYSTPDKAAYKAITSGHKYFLMKLLNIGAGNEDSEHDDEQPTPVSTPAKNGNGHKPAEMTLESAAELKTAKGTRLGDMTSDQLVLVNEKSTDETLRRAASLLIDAMIANQSPA